jgi:hypothetical protein
MARLHKRQGEVIEAYHTQREGEREMRRTVASLLTTFFEFLGMWANSC